MDKTKVIFEGCEDEIYAIFGECQTCKCAHIMEIDNYCPKCGLSIEKNSQESS